MRLKRTIVLTTLGLLAALAVSACVRDTGPVALTAQDSGSARTLAVGQELRISLESNPTTGYRWALDGPLPPQLGQKGEPAFTSGSTAVGSGGTEVWTFAGASTGTGTLKLKYWRSFEPTAAPAARFEVTVDVK